jgi:hypothetical protein
VIGNAAIFNFSRHRDRQTFMNANNIPADVDALFRLLDERSVFYVLVGGVAMLAHVRGRNTDDIDLVLSTSDQAKLAPEVSIVERESFFAVGRFRDSLRIDFLATDNPFFLLVAREYSDARRIAFLGEGRHVRCATPEGLLLLKLYALPSLYRQYDFERVAAYESDIGKLLIAFPEIDTEKLLGVLSEHGLPPSDVAELRKVLTDVRARFNRFSTPEGPPDPEQ